MDQDLVKKLPDYLYDRLLQEVNELDADSYDSFEFDKGCVIILNKIVETLTPLERFIYDI